MGVPVIGCSCPVCSSPAARDYRLRSSGLLQLQRKKILIDCGPDFRYQALKKGISELDGVVITHAHYDHTAGIDELRAFSSLKRRALPCLLSRECGEEIKSRFDYLFKKRAEGSMVAKIELNYLPAESGEVSFLGIEFGYFTYKQGNMAVNGFRLGKFAYVTDICDYPSTIYQALRGVELLVLSALRFTPSPIHFSVDEAVDFARRVGAKSTWLTHISHDLQHEKADAYLPSDVKMAYDGLEIDIW